ncbi:MAG: oligosaccharide flippase family protein [Bacteroidales bacterium]|nr:oligosaccharide flippase family protein [Bacteroidales bacterium]MCF8403475.1 oligosaccharide flippase family protein [Bacteroidales bacterium]
MNPIKQLAGQTAIYGLGTIVPRLLNYLLVPLYTRLLLREEYGVVTELYAYIAFFFVLLMYGMETTFFRFAEKDKEPNKVFSTSLVSIFTTSALFILLVVIFISPVADFLKYPEHKDYIILAAAIIGIDAFTAIQFAYLRYLKMPIKFSFVKIITVSVNVALNLYFILFCDVVYKNNPDSPWLILYNPEYKVGYIFVSNLIASLVSIFMLLPQLFHLKLRPSIKLLRKMLIYALPLLIVGVSGMINEVVDKIIFKYLAPVPAGVEDVNRYILSELGVYGANFKLAVLMTLFIQMFRYAAEPFFFAQAKEINAKQVYADVMKYFVIFGLLIFLGVTLFIDVFKYFIGPEHWVGLRIVPIVLLANLFLGIFYNLSVWYKLTDLTKFGAIIAVIGSIITITLNLLLVPKFSYLGASLGHLGCYLAMMIISYFWGRKYFPIPYDLRKIFSYSLLAFGLFVMSKLLISPEYPFKILLNGGLFIIFMGIVYYFEKKITYIKPS